MSRIELIKNFLAANNIANYQLEKVAGDASFRHYFRAILKDKSFIIMDAPPPLEDILPFCKVADFLLANNFPAPQIFARDAENGFLLLEDFGDQSYRKAIEQGAEEILLYQNAVNLLVNLSQIKAPNYLPIYNSELLLKEVMLFIDWYLPNVAKIQISSDQITQFQEIWQNLFIKLSPPQHLVLRDYHADNLMLLDNKNGIESVGLLDFQDAVIGSNAYDLVSLLEDARRDVSQNTQQKMLQHYLQQSNCNSDQFSLDYEILSLQRNIKIAGIFSRLAFRDGKTDYLNLLPRVFGYINSRLEYSNFPNDLLAIKQFLQPFLIK